MCFFSTSSNHCRRVQFSHLAFIHLYVAQLNLKSSIILKHAAPQSEDYNVEQIHFHWGHRHDDTNGSEHSLEGKFYPLEVW